MSEVITDALGRKITIRKMTILDQYRLDIAMGEHSSNQGAMLKAETATLAAAIDGVLVPFPSNESQVRALVGRLGDEGMAVLFTRRMNEVKAVMAAAEAAIAGGNAADPLDTSAASPNTPDSAASFTS